MLPSWRNHSRKVYFTDRNFNTVLRRVSSLIITFVYFWKNFGMILNLKCRIFANIFEMHPFRKKEITRSRAEFTRFLAIQTLANGLLSGSFTQLHFRSTTASRSSYLNKTRFARMDAFMASTSNICCFAEMRSWNLLNLYLILILILDKIQKCADYVCF